MADNWWDSDKVADTGSDDFWAADAIASSTPPKEPGTLDQIGSYLSSALESVGQFGSDLATRAEANLPVLDPRTGKLGPKEKPINSVLTNAPMPEFNAAEANRMSLKSYVEEQDRMARSGQVMRATPEVKLTDAQRYAEANPIKASLKSGAATALAGTFNAPAVALQSVNEMVGNVGRGLGADIPVTRVPNMPLVDGLMKMGGEYTSQLQRRAPGEAWDNGEFGNWMLTQLGGNSMSMMQSLGALFVPGAQATLLSSMGAQAAGTSYAQGDSGISSALKGVVEAGSEMLPLKAAEKIKDVVGAIPLSARSGALEMAGRKLLAGGAAITTNSLVGAIEESVAQIGGNALDVLVDGQTKSLFDEVDRAAIVGAAANTTLAAPAILETMKGAGQGAPRSNFLADQAQQDAQDAWARYAVAPAVPASVQMAQQSQAAQADSDQAMQAISTASNVDDAIAAATQAVGSKQRAVNLDNDALLSQAMEQAEIAASELAMVPQAPIADPVQSVVDAPVAPSVIPQTEPVGATVWTGRRGNGYATEADAARAQAERTKTRPMFDWTIQPNAEGRYVLAGVKRDTQEALPEPLPALPAEVMAEESPGVAGRKLEESPASWVIRNKATREVVMETTQRSVAEKVNTDKYEALPVQDHLASLSESPATVLAPAVSEDAPQQPVRLGRNQQSLAEGGKPFATRTAAAEAKKSQPTMRVVKVDGGFALADKTPAQLAAEQKTALRLSQPNTSQSGEPIPAHAAIAAAGGLQKLLASDLGVEGNPRIGNRTLYAGKGRGLTIEQATEQLIEQGYLNEGASHNDAYALIKRSLTQPQYNADGIERIAEAEFNAEFDDYLTAQQEAAEQPDFDPFADGMADGYIEDDFDSSGYTPADDQIRAEVMALIAQADAMGIDSEMLIDDAVRATTEQTEQEYYEFARNNLQQALAESSGGSRDPAPNQDGAEQQGQEAERRGRADSSQDDGAESFALDQQTPEQARREQEEAAAASRKDKAAKEAADLRALQEELRKDIAQRSEAAADSFELGGDALDNLSGQGAMFSRAPSQPNQRQDAKAVQRVQSVVDAISEKWQNKPKVEIARSMQDPIIPKRVRDYDAELKKRGAEGEARGFIYGGKVYLVADQLRTDADVAETLFHEVMGHYGLRGAFGEALAPVLREVGDLRRKDVVAKAVSYRLLDKKKLSVPVDKATDKQIWAAMTLAHRREAAEELLAELAQSRPEIGFVKRAVAAIRSWLRANVPAFNRLKLSDSEIIQKFLLPARGFVERGGSMAGNNQTAFSRGTNEAMTNNDVVGNTQGGRSADDTTPGAQSSDLLLAEANSLRAEAYALELHLRDFYGKDENGYKVDLWPESSTREFDEKYQKADELTKTAQTIEKNEYNANPERIKRKNKFLRDVENAIEEGEYVSYGIRGNSKNPRTGKDVKVKIGSIAKPSYYQPDGNTTNTQHGTSAITVDSETVEWSFDLAKQYIARGEKILLLGSDRAKGGNDPNEIEMSNAKILAIYDDNIPNESTAPDSGGAAFSRATDQTQTEAFKKWFKDSAVVNTDGKPRVVYHGTTADFTQFSKQKATDRDGRRLGMGWGKGKFYFAETGQAASSAASFAQATGRGEAQSVMPVYLSLKNPVDAADYMARVDQQAAAGKSRDAAIAAVDKALLRAGHDGIMDAETGGIAVFEPTQIKSAIGNAGQFDPANPDIRFSRTPPRQGNRFLLPGENGARALRRKTQDYFIRMRDVQDTVVKQGGFIDESTNVYDAEVLSHGRANAQLQDFAFDQVEPLMKKLVKMGVEMDEFSLYAYAKHAEERNNQIAKIDPNTPDGGSGMTNAEADSILQLVALSGDQAKFDELHADLMAITQTNRLVMLDEGLITQEEYDALDGMYENYIPLRGFEVVDEDNKPTGRGAGKGFNIRGKETVRALGRKSRAGQLVENVISDYQRTVVRAERNQVAKVFLNFVLNNQDKALWEIDATTTRKSLQRQTGLVTRSTTVDKGEDTISVKVKGREIYIKINDPLLLRAMLRSHANEASELERLITRISGLYTSLLRNTLTRYNPEFALVNSARDFGFGSVAMLDALGEKGVAKFTAHYAGATMASVRSERRTGDPVNREWDKWFEEYRAVGGITGGFYQKGVEEITGDIRSMMVEAGAKPKDWTEKVRYNKATSLAKSALRVLEFAGSVSENAARVSAYRTAREMGKTRAEAALLAKGLTTNFDRKGEYGQMINSLYVFFNAAVQGAHKTLQMLANPKVQAYMVGLSSASVALAFANAFAGGDDPDDGMTYWDKIPDYIKERNLIIMLPAGIQVEGAEEIGTKGRYLMIPMQYGLNIPHVIGYGIADHIRNMQDKTRGITLKEAGLRIASAVAGSFNPFDGSIDLTNPSSMAQAVTPSIFDPVVQMATGTNSFGRDVAPFKSPFDSKPDSYNSNVRQAGSPAEKISQWLNSATGGRSFESGGIDVSPGTIENMVRNMTGGTGMFIYDVVSLSANAIERATGNDPDLFIREIPLARRVYGETAGDVDQGLFYDRRKKIEEARAVERGAEEEGVEITDPAKNALASMAKDTGKYSKWLSDIRKEMKEIQSDKEMARGDRKIKLRELRAERDRLTAEFNKDFSEVMREAYAETPD